MMLTIHIAAWAVLSLTLTYAWWVKLRVWIYRQELFRIRDELWATMYEKGTLDDPAHRQVRAGINALIRFAPRASVLTFRAFANVPANHDFIHPDDMPPEVRKAFMESVMLSARYILFKCVTGLVFMAFYIAKQHKQAISSQLNESSRKIRRAFNTTEMRTTDWRTPAGV